MSKFSKYFQKSFCVLIFTLFISTCLFNVSAADKLEFCYSEDNGGVIITGYSGEMPEKLIIPSKLDNKVVVGIEDHVFDGYRNSSNEKIKSLEMPDTITYIGECAFRGCLSLEKVKLSKNLKNLEGGAFCDCDSLVKITIPDGVKEIADNLFADSEKLKEVYFSKDVKRIGYNSFSQCKSLETFVCPEGIKEIEWRTFSFCDKLKSVYLPKSVEVIAEDAFAGCNLLSDISIPSGVTEIGPSAFWHCDNITEIVLPKGLKRIEDYTFAFSGIKKINIPSGVEYIGSYAFDCCKFTEITLPKGLKYIANGAFSACQSLKKIVVPGGVEILSANIFENCSSLETVILENGVKYINKEAFLCCDVENLYLPDSLIRIEDSVFSYSYCYTNPAKVYYSGSKKEWNSIEIWEDNEELYSAKFEYDYISTEHTKLKKHKATEAKCDSPGYTEGLYCKHCNKWLKGHHKIEVLHTDKNNDRICDVCNNTTLIESGKCECENNVTWNLYDNGDLVVNGKNTITYCYIDVAAKNKVKKIIIGEGIESSGSYYDFKNLETVILSDTVKSIDERAFYSCTALKNVVIPDSVKNINMDAFRYCRSLEKIKLPENLKGIESYSFLGCLKLKNIVFPESIKYIDEYAFGYCKSLEEIIVPDNVKSIGACAFEHCDKLRKVSIGTKTKSIDSYTFLECNNLEAFVVSKNNNYFSTDKYGVLFNKDKTKLLKVPGNLQIENYIIPDSVKIIGKLSLANLKNINLLVIPTSVNKLYYTEMCSNKNLIVCYTGSKDKWNKVKVKEGEYYNFKKSSVICNFTKKSIPGKVEIKSVTTSAKQIAINWKAINGADGYLIEYSTSKNFSDKATKSLTVKKGNTTKTIIKKLKKGKKYYVRIKAYNTVNGKKIFGAYSSVKSVKVK